MFVVDRVWLRLILVEFSQTLSFLLVSVIFGHIYSDQDLFVLGQCWSNLILLAHFWLFLMSFRVRYFRPNLVVPDWIWLRGSFPSILFMFGPLDFCYHIWFGSVLVNFGQICSNLNQMVCYLQTMIGCDASYSFLFDFESLS